MLASQERAVEENQPLTRETHAPSSSPSAFGRFRVVHQVGAGVLGPVFRAYDPDSERTVALKSFPLDLTPERAHELASAFGQLITLELAHPSLIVPTAAGAEGSTAYIVEEYFVADSVDVALRQYGPAPVPDAVRLVGQLAGALDFAAAVGVHHGALHPRDVLVAPREVRLTGIGIAEALEKVGVRMPPRRPYSAPERVEPDTWGVASDVFSLAALSYELLTGRRPAASGETLAIEPQAVPASDTDALVEVFARAFSPQAADRFPSALAFAAALKHALTGQPLEAPEDDRPRSRRARPAARKADMLPLGEPEAVPEAAFASMDFRSEGRGGADRDAPPETAPEAGLAPAPQVGALPPEPPSVADSTPPVPTVADQPRADEPKPRRKRARVEAPAPPPAAVPESVPDPAPVYAEPEPPATLLPAETSEVREALMAGEPEALIAGDPDAPAPPLTLDDLGFRDESASPAHSEDERFDLHATEAPPTDEWQFSDAAADVAGSGEPPARSIDAERDHAMLPMGSRDVAPVDRGEAAPPVRLTPAYRPPAPPRRRTSTAARLMVAIAAIAAAVAGGYYGASQYLGRGGDSAASAPVAPAGESEAGLPQEQSVPPPAEHVPQATPALPGPTGAGARGSASGTEASSGAPASGAARVPPRTGAAAGSPPPDGRSGSATAKPETKKTSAVRPKAPSRAATPAPARRAQPVVFEGSLTIVSRPPGARVFLDGHPVGTTPMTMSKVSAGSHAVRLQSDGYATWSAAIQVVAGEQGRVTASLDRLPR